MKYDPNDPNPITQRASLLRSIIPTLNAGTAERVACLMEVAAPYGLESRPKVLKPSDVARVVDGLGERKQEALVALYLDSQNGLLRRETITLGSLNTVRAHPREIFAPGLAMLAAGLILVHNHPSGQCEPSVEDIEFTEAVRKAGELVGVPLLDHVIVATGGAYVSLRERGAGVV